MSSTYSSMFGNIWPPPNQETMERLQRLKELQEMRQNREGHTSRTTAHSNVREDTSVSDVSSSRANRRQHLSTYRQPTSRLRDRQDEIRSRNVERSSSLLNRSRENLSEPFDYGGAKPKRLGYSHTMTENDNSRSEILRELRYNALREQGKHRDRTISNGSDTSEEQSPLYSMRRNAMEEVQTVEETNENQESSSLVNDAENEVKKQDLSAESESLDPHEDIELFKQSLFGSHSLGARNDFGSSSLKPFSLNESPKADNIDISRFGFSNTIERSTFPRNDYSEMPSRSEKTNVRGTYSVREGFKRIDDLFDSNPTRSRTSITSDSIKMRSRIGKTANTEIEKNRTIQGNERSKDLHSSDIEKQPSRVVDKDYSSETVVETSITESGGKTSNDNSKETDTVQSPTESKRVLIFDGENMVVEDENTEQETIIEAGDMNQDAGVMQKSIVNEAMNASEEITLQQSHLNDVDLSSRIDTGVSVETSHVDIDDDLETSHVDTGYDVETSRVDTNYDVETTDSGPVIIGSFSSNDIDMETNTNESESVLTENDSIFDYKQRFQGIDSYFDSMESNAPRESYPRESYSRQYRKETPSYSRTKSMPYGNTGRTNRYSSLPSTVDEKIEEIRARYNSRNIETNVDAPSSSYFSNVGRSYDYGSSLSDRRSFLTKSHSTVGTSDSTSRSESVLSRIMNRSFKSIDDYFGPQKDDVVLKRRTARTARTEKTTQEADTETVSSEYNRRLLRHDINISSDTSERTLHDTETGASQKTDDTEIESGTTLKSDVTERESNFIEEFESETISYMTGVEDDLSEETYTNVEDGIVNPTNEADDNVDDISEEESEEQTEIVEMEQNQPDTYIVESGDFVHLDPEAVPITEKSIEDKSGYENQGETEVPFKPKKSDANEEAQNDKDHTTPNNVENDENVTSGANNIDSKNNEKGKSKKKEKKKKSKKKKDQPSKEITHRTNNGEIGKVETTINGLNEVGDKSVESTVTSESDTISEKSSTSKSDASSPSKTSSKFRKFFDGIMSVIDHRSDKTSVATEDLLSLDSQEGVVNDKLSSDASLKSELAKSNTSKGVDVGSVEIVHEDNYAKFEDEDLPSRSEDGGSKHSPLPDEASATSAEADAFETASETTESGEFFEAVPAELLEGLLNYKGESNVSVERKEKFVYVCPSTKIRRKKIKMKSLLGTSVVKKQAKLREKQRLGQVKAWMENNIFPVEDETQDTKVTPTKSNSSIQGSAFSVESVIDETESKSSISSHAQSTPKTSSSQTITSLDGTTSKKLISSTSQTDISSSVRKSSTTTQTVLKTWNIGVQVETLLLNKGSQTLSELICPCCSHTIDIMAALNRASESIDPKVSPRPAYKTSDNLSNESNTVMSKEQDASTISNTPASLSVISQNISPSSTSKESSLKTSPSASPPKISPSSTPSKQTPVPPPRNVKSPRSEKKATVKTRREKVADVKEMLYNSEISKNTSAKITRKPPTPAKAKNGDDPRERLKSNTSENERESTPRTGSRKTKSREPSEDRSSCAGSENNGDIPSYMQPTRSSSRKSSKSRENSAERMIDGNESKNVSEQKKLKRLNSQKKSKSRESSADRSEFGDRDSENKIDGLPSFMQPTRSSNRKKSDAFLPNKDEKSKKPVSQSNSNSGNEDDNQEHIMSVNDNPFIRNDPKKRGSKKKTKESGLSVWERLGLSKKQDQEGKGKWYRKEPIADGASPNSKKAKGKSPKKSRALSLTAIDMISDNSNVNDGSGDNDQIQSESKTKLLVTDIDFELEPSIATNGHVSGNDSHGTEVNINGHTNGNEGETKLIFDSNTISSTVADNETKSPSSQSERDKDDTNHVEPGEDEEGPAELSADEKALAQDQRRVQEVEDDEKAPVRINFKSWDPSKLLKDLYSVRLMSDTTEDISDKFIAMEGLMEKLPMNKKKATLLKTWKRRFFRASDGWLHYFETGSRDKPSDSLQLMGGRVDDLGNRILGIDDGRGRYLMVRCPTDKEYGQWKLALESQTADNVKATYVRPALTLPQHPNKSIVIIDIGCSAIRAGILGEQASLPKLFFPSTVARNKTTSELVTGIEAYTPEIRHQSELRKPVYPTEKVDKFGIDVETIDVVFKKIFSELGIDSTKFWVMISTPQNLGDKVRAGLMKILVDQFHVKGVCMSMQALLALYSYNATSGIIVDIGERMEILPIYDGYVIEGGVSRQSYGGQKVAESLKHSLEKYKFSTPIQQLLVRYVMEQSCYVTSDYKDTLKKCEEDPDNYKTMVSLSNYDLPEGADITVTHDYSCFKSPEGFFNTDLWGMDYPCVHKLVFKAIQSCPMDGRKRMYRAVYLSGGVTLLPGFAERLQLELSKLAPPSVMVEVHSSPNRYHSAYIGACSLANMEQFQQICISSEEWKKDGVKAFKKWNMTS